MCQSTPKQDQDTNENNHGISTINNTKVEVHIPTLAMVLGMLVTVILLLIGIRLCLKSKFFRRGRAGAGAYHQRGQEMFQTVSEVPTITNQGYHQQPQVIYLRKVHHPKPQTSRFVEIPREPINPTALPMVQQPLLPRAQQETSEISTPMNLERSQVCLQPLGQPEDVDTIESQIKNLNFQQE